VFARAARSCAARRNALWARRVDPVTQLTDEGHWPYPTRITDAEAYEAQMRRLLGLE